MRQQIVPNAPFIRFRYLDFSMASAGSVSLFMVKPYNHIHKICIIIFSFHANKLYGVRINSIGNFIFPLSSIFDTCKNNLVFIFSGSPSDLIPCNVLNLHKIYLSSK
jgi:hypothetical protein